MDNTYRFHPWHGVETGANAPEIVTAYIEITPSDTVKYEIDKASGILKVDRPQLYSNVVPALYGFIPQTYCKEEIASLCMHKTKRVGMDGDGDHKTFFWGLTGTLAVFICLVFEKYGYEAFI